MRMLYNAAVIMTVTSHAKLLIEISQEQIPTKRIFSNISFKGEYNYPGNKKETVFESLFHSKIPKRK